MLAYSSVKMQSHDAIFHPIFSSNSLSTKIIPCDYLIESRKWSIKVDWKSKVCAIFNHLSDENHDITMNFYHSIRILNRFDWKSFRVTTSTINSNRFTWAIKSIDNRMNFTDEQYLIWIYKGCFSWFNDDINSLHFKKEFTVMKMLWSNFHLSWQVTGTVFWWAMIGVVPWSSTLPTSIQRWWRSLLC